MILTDFEKKALKAIIKRAAERNGLIIKEGQTPELDAVLNRNRRLRGAMRRSGFVGPRPATPRRPAPPPRPRPAPQLSWWQRLLRALGVY